ncbi:MAG: DUF2809 domain-containing protein [Clostridia bacterium]|nr:DUF2809 domain-containing protein [Clostridia bacterium]
MKNKIKLTYFLVFTILLVTEILTALFVHDGFVRPYIGDILVVGVICAFLRLFVPEKIRVLPILTSVFAAGIELLQLFDFVDVIGLSGSRFFSILLGRTFDIKDIICYVIGGLIFFAAENLARRKTDEF